ncbi:DnaJ family domain-containing protein [Shimia haliotis]|uniref:DnaJ homologue subfamily C member 28 conserved domain-containing protein n=1 Tax=Shimia haliotis TaxID=1280847 RepID=A0A1I4DBW8_9RHOB|nr:DnaJ family domain-containing protein [Shimia haliotis]SFK91304.1 protein of unknown function [Shimia haliotis]
MSHPLNPAIEMAMQSAERSDEFKDLAGAGRPLEFLSRPKDAVVDRIMKENKVVPVAVQLKKQLSELHAALKAETDPGKRKDLMRQISDHQLRLALELEALNKYG